MKGKNTKKIVFGSILLLILIACYILIKNLDHGEAEENKEEISLLSIPSDSIVSLSFGADGKVFSFTKEEDLWKSSDKTDLELNQDSMNTLAASLENLKASRVLENVEDLNQYGLDQPSNVIRVIDKGGNQTTISVGDVNDSIGSCYVYLNDDKSTVDMVESSFSTGFQVGLYDLAQKETFPSVTGSTITSMLINKDDKEFILAKDSESETGWMVTNWDDIQKPAGSSEVSTELNKFSSLIYESYVNYNAEDLSIYGLDFPTATITLDYQVTKNQETGSDDTDSSSSGESSADEEMENKQLIIMLGTTDQNGNYYVKTGESAGIYTMKADSLTGFLNADSNAYLDKYVSNISFADLNNLIVTKGGTSYQMESKSSEVTVENSQDEENKTTTKLMYYVNQKEANEEHFMAFYSAVTAIQAQSRLDQMPEDSGSLEMTLQFNKSNGSENIVNYYLYDANFYLVTDSSDNFFLVNKIKVKEMLKKWETLISVVNAS